MPTELWVAGQVNVRLGIEDDADLSRYAAEQGLERTALAKEFVRQGLEACREGRAIFDRPELPTPADLQHLTTKIQTMSMELDRVLRQNDDRADRLAQDARADAVGVSEARTAIITQLTAEMHRLIDMVLTGLAGAPAAQVAAITASPTMVGITAALTRIEQDPRLDKICMRQEAHTLAMREHTKIINRLIEQPRTVIRFLVWDRDWSARRVVAGLAVVWLFCVGSYHGVARMLPASWLAVRSASLQMGGGDRTICAFLNYRLSTTDCVTRFDLDTMRATVEARHVPATSRR